jgi:hypothetical protein
VGSLIATRLKQAEELLAELATVFRTHEALHKMKGMAGEEKAKANAELANRIESFINSEQEQGQPIGKILHFGTIYSNMYGVLEFNGFQIDCEGSDKYPPIMLLELVIAKIQKELDYMIAQQKEKRENGKLN